MALTHTQLGTHGFWARLPGLCLWKLLLIVVLAYRGHRRDSYLPTAWPKCCTRRVRLAVDPGQPAREYQHQERNDECLREMLGVGEGACEHKMHELVHPAVCTNGVWCTRPRMVTPVSSAATGLASGRERTWATRM